MTYGNIFYVNGGVPANTGIDNIYIDYSNPDGASAQQYTQTLSSAVTTTVNKVQGVQAIFKGTYHCATPAGGTSEINMIRGNHLIASDAGKNLHFHAINSLVTAENDVSGSSTAGGTEGAVLIGTFRTTGPTTGTAYGSWGGDLHVEKYPGVADGKMVGLEVGMHKAPALGTGRNRGIDLWSGPRSGATPATRAGDGLFISGEAGWTNPLRIQYTDGTTDLWKVDQYGNLTAVVPAGNAMQLVQTVANNSYVTYQQVGRTSTGATVSGVFQTSANQVLLGSTSATSIVISSNSVGRVIVEASTGNTRPFADNSYSLGTSVYRWSTVYAATGTINTSHGPDKIVTGDLNGFASNLLDLVDPVLFKWKCGSSTETQTGTRKVKTGNLIEKKEKRIFPEMVWQIVDGVGKEVEVVREIEVPVYGEPVHCLDADGAQVIEKVMVFDEDGNAVIGEDGAPVFVERPKLMANPIMVEEEIDEAVFETVANPGKRTHAGFIAQDVKSAMDKLGADFAVWGLEDVEDKESRQWLRPDQLIPVLWASLKDTRREMVELKSQLSALS